MREQLHRRHGSSRRPRRASTTTSSTCSRPGSTAASWCCAGSTGRRRRSSWRRSSATRRCTRSATGTTCAPHRSAGPALLRVLPSGAGRRAADLRRGRAHPRHPDRDRADPVRQARAPIDERATTAVFYSISNCQRGLAGVSFGNFLIKQVVEEISARNSPPLDLRHAVAGAGFRRMAQARARERGLRAQARGPRRAQALDRSRLVARPADRRGGARAAAARGLVLLRARTPRGRRSIRSRASISATARGSNGSTCSPIPRSEALRQSHGLMVNYLYDLEDIEKNHEAYAQQRQVVPPSAVSRWCARPARDAVSAEGGTAMQARRRRRLPAFSIDRHHAAAGDPVLRRGQEQDRRRHVLDLASRRRGRLWAWPAGSPACPWSRARPR